MDKEPKLDAEALVELGKNLEEMCAEYRFGYCFGCPFRGDGDLFFCDKSSFTNRTAELYGRPIFSHELPYLDDLADRAKADLLALCAEVNDE